MADNILRPTLAQKRNKRYRLLLNAIDPTLVLWYDFKNEKSLEATAALGPTLSITRATDATYFDSTGTIQTAGANTARFDHDPNTLESLGLLVEEARTNLFLNSDVPVTQGVSVSAIAHTISVWGTGSITLSGAGTGVATEGSPVTVITSAGTLTCTATGSLDRVQVEAGPFGTSFILTAGSSATRNVDIVTTDDVSWFAAEGTLYAEASRPHVITGSSDGILAIHNGVTNYVDLWSNANGSLATSVVATTVSNNLTQSGIFKDAQRHRMAFTVVDSDYQSYFDGRAEAIHDTSGGLPVGVDTFDVGGLPPGGGTAAWNGHIAVIKYFETRKTDAEMAILTSGVLYTGMVVGDSFSEDEGTWFTMLSTNAYSYAVGGRRIVAHIEPAFTAELLDAQTLFPDTSYCIIQGGVNDANAGVASTSIEAATTTMVNEAIAAGLDVIVIGIAPWKNAAGWSAANQTETDAYNAWLAANDTVLGFTYVDIYTSFEGAADELIAIYDSGDGLHPNEAGHRAIGALVDSAVAAL